MKWAKEPAFINRRQEMFSLEQWISEKKDVQSWLPAREDIIDVLELRFGKISLAIIDKIKSERRRF